MNRSIDKIISKMPKAQQRDIQARYEELHAEELTLRELRKALKLTQEKMAKILNTRQGSISKIEKRSDMLLSTLREYVQAMGGDLDLVVRFPDHKPISLIGWTED